MFRTALAVIGILLISVSAGFAEDRPNILWLSCEDISPHLHCYGFENATTPVLDRFSEESILFQNAYTTAGVCAPSRSAIITGMYQTSIGTHHMRCNALLPDHVKPFTIALREAGYYCTNNSKQDYQFKTPSDTWDESSRKAHWKNRPNGQTPFFAVFNYTGCHESGIASEGKYESVTEGLKPHNRNTVSASLPPYYPDTELTRDDWGRYYDVITSLDRWVGQQLEELQAAGLADNTIVIFWSDHGVGLPRAKRWLYESGTWVPLMVRVPKKFQQLAGDLPPGSKTDRLVSMIDLGPTTLSLAGLKTPDHMHGKAFLGPHAADPRQYIFGARDRMDERYDIIRMVRDQRYRYIRNYEPYKTWYQYMNTPEKGRTMKEIRRVEAAGAASDEVARFLQDSKPLEELYDVRNDPHELNNLAANPDFAKKLQELREQHLNWVVRTRDLGLIPEAELHRLREEAGSEWAILNETENPDELMTVIRDAAVLAGGSDVAALDRLVEWLRHENATVRYWAATGIGNRIHLPQTFQIPTAALVQLLDDPSENVQVAAARALAGLGQQQLALSALSHVLDDGTQWARLHAAIVLDEMDETARPALEAMQRNKSYRDGFVANGKYTVRVLNKAVNDLLGTSESVP